MICHEDMYVSWQRQPKLSFRQHQKHSDAAGVFTYTTYTYSNSDVPWYSKLTLTMSPRLLACPKQSMTVQGRKNDFPSSAHFSSECIEDAVSKARKTEWWSSCLWSCFCKYILTPLTPSEVGLALAALFGTPVLILVYTCLDHWFAAVRLCFLEYGVPTPPGRVGNVLIQDQETKTCSHGCLLLRKDRVPCSQHWQAMATFPKKSGNQINHGRAYASKPRSATY